MVKVTSKEATKALLMAAGLILGLGVGAAQAADPDAELAALAGKVLSTGPNGETPSPASVVTLSDDEIAKVKAMHATAAIVLHYGGNDWSRAQVAGLKAEFADLGIDVIAVTDAGFKPETQVADIETVLAKKPNIIASIPVDPVSEAGAYKKAADAGVKLVFMDNVPKGLVAGKDYVSVVSADNYGNGVAAGLLMAKFLKGKGTIGAVFHAADFFVTKQRYQGFQKAISEFPDIKIIESQGIGGPDFSGDADKVASAMITAHPDIDGIWAVWDVPAEGVISAARTANKSNLIIATEDLGENVAINMAKGGFVKGLGAQRPYDQGVTEAKLAAYALLGKKAPDYVALPSLAVTKDNLLDAWKAVYHTDAPADVKGSMK
ncbi:MAG: substrate-binding domain-containing protein [Roseiarcus sp.]